MKTRRQSAGSRRPEVIVFAKPAQLPLSRLSRRMGQAGAALLHHRLLVRTLRHLRNTGFEVSVAVGGDAPDYADIAERAGADVLLMPQGDVGRRLARTIRHRRSAAILVDSDAPGIDAILVRHAADALGQYDLVLGPNWSGGTYLIGLRSPYHVYRLFRGVRWRTAHMLEDLLARVPKHWIVGLLPVLADVNDAAGLREAGSDHAPPRRRSSSRGLIAVKR